MAADLVFVQATVVSTAHLSPESVTPLDLADFCQSMPMPVLLGNCVTYEVALNLMKAGAAGVLVGIGPGAACLEGFWEWAFPKQRRLLTVRRLEMTTINHLASMSPSLRTVAW